MTLPGGMRLDAFRPRPIAAMLTMFTLGAVLAPLLPVPSLICYPLAALTALIALAVPSPRGRAALLLLPFLLLGVGRARDTFVPDDDNICRFTGHPSLWVRGQVTSLVEGTEHDGYRFILTADRVYDYRTTVTVSGRLRVALRHRPAPPVGAYVWLRGQVLSLPPATNPGAFDYRAFSERHGIFCRMSVRYPGDQKIETVPRFSLLGVAQAIRQWVQAQTQQHLAPDDAALLNGLLLSITEDIPATTQDTFQRTETVHILSVSGLHMTAFAGVLVFLGRYFLLPRPFANLTSIALLWLFALAAGATAAPVRSAIMATVWLAAPLVRRSAEPLHSWCFAALLVLFADPGNLYDAGFLLSFASVGGLLLYVPPLSERYLRPHHGESRLAMFTRCILLALLVGVIAEVSTVPLVAYYFNQWSLIGAVANVLIAVWSEWLLLGGLATVGLSPIVGWVYAPLVHWLWLPMVWGLWLIRWMAQAFAALPFAAVYVPSPPVWSLGSHNLCFVGLGLAVRRKFAAEARLIFQSVPPSVPSLVYNRVDIEKPASPL